MKALTSLDYVGKPVDSRQGQEFKPWPKRTYRVIQCLPFLRGRFWDDMALAYVHALRPSRIRVVYETIQLDAVCWRVTVYLSSRNKIKCIEQEVEIGIPPTCKDPEGL